MPLRPEELSRLAALRERRPASDLSDSEIIELYKLEKLAAPTSYGWLVAALSTFPPYLDRRPHLIAVFLPALYSAGRAAFRGFQTQADLQELLISKSVIDNDLHQALQNHPAEFELGLALAVQ